MFMLVFAALEAVFLPSRLSERSKQTLDGVRVSLGGSHLAQVAIGVLGVLVITSEYTSGLIRAPGRTMSVKFQPGGPAVAAPHSSAGRGGALSAGA